MGKNDRSFVHASHEAARSEHAGLKDDSPNFEVREREQITREHAKGWAERITEQWLAVMNATETTLTHRGADVTFRAECELGPILVRMFSPFQVDRGTAAVCEPCLVRVEIGSATEPPQAWFVDGDGKIQMWTVAPGKLEAVLFPLASFSLLSSVRTADDWLGSAALADFYDEVVALANDSERAVERAWTMSHTAAEEICRDRWIDVGKLAPRRWQREHWNEIESVIGSLRTFVPFDTFEAQRGEQRRTGAVIMVGDRDHDRDLVGTRISVDGRVRGRSQKWDVELEADLYRMAPPPNAHRAAQLIPQSWVAVRVAPYSATSTGTQELLQSQPQSPTHHLWLENGDLVARGLSGALEALSDRASSIRVGPYR